MELLLQNVRAVLPGTVRLCDVRIRGGRIGEIATHLLPLEGEEIRDCGGAVLMPGWIDTHNHGGLSRAFFHEDADYAAIADSYARRGTTAMLPTLSCMPEQRFEETARRLVRFAKEQTSGAKFVGIHAEGPFLNPIRHGGMIKEYIAPPDCARFQRMADACGGMLRILTLAPEVEGADSLIREALACGVSVSAGHTNATHEEMLHAAAIGLTRMTHTFNACRPLSHRDPGVIGAVLQDPRITCEVIGDFAHLHPATVQMILSLKGSTKVTLISDYSDGKGYAARGEGKHQTEDGTPYTVRGGVAWSESGGVMGNANDMAVSVRNLRSLSVPLYEIAEMASANPAKAAGIYADTGSIEIGKAADLVLCEDDLTPIAVYVDGSLVR